MKVIKQMHRREAVYIALLAIIALVFSALSYRQLRGFSWCADEGIFLMTAKQLQDGHSLYRDVWFNYPPLYFVSLASAFRLFGATVAVGRTVVVLFATLGIVSVSLVTRNIIGRFGAIFSAVILATLPLYWRWNRSVALGDLPAASVSTLALLFGLRAIATNKAFGGRCFWLSLGGGTLALSLLIKPTTCPVVIPLVLAALLSSHPLVSEHWPRNLGPGLAAFGVSGLLITTVIMANFALRPFLEQFWGFIRASEANEVGLIGNLKVIEEISYQNQKTRYLEWLVWVVGGGMGLTMCERRKGIIILSWLVATLSFLLFPGSVGSRHYVTLSFPVAVFAGIALGSGWQAVHQAKGNAKRLYCLTGGAITLCSILLCIPFYVVASARVLPYEGPRTEKARLAVSFLTDATRPADLVLADGDGIMIAYRAGRKTIPWLANMSGKRLETGNLSPQEITNLADLHRAKTVILWNKYLDDMASVRNWLTDKYYLARAYDPVHRIYLRLSDIRYPQRAGLQEVELVGFDLDSYAVQSGEDVDVTLYWRGLRRMHTKYTVFVHLVDSGGRRHAQIDEVPADGSLPTTQWPVKDIIKDEHRLSLPDGIPPGFYYLKVGMYNFHTMDRLPAYRESGSLWGGNAIRLARPLLVNRDVSDLYLVPSISHPADIQFGNHIRLLGYNLRRENRTQGREDTELLLTLYWRATGRPDDNYTVFVHVLDKDNEIIAQDDAMPGDGLRPTIGWVRGEVVPDTHRLSLEARGVHRIAVGLYDRVTGERLEAIDGQGTHLSDDRFVLGMPTWVATRHPDGNGD